MARAQNTAVSNVHKTVMKQQKEQAYAGNTKRNHGRETQQET